MKQKSSQQETTGPKKEKGELIWKGWSTSASQIPQPVSIVYGANLRESSKREPKSDLLDLQNLPQDPAEAAVLYSDELVRKMRQK